NEKLLGLVAAHALLFQHQRELSGSAVVAEPRDYAAIHALLEPGLTRDLDGLSPRAVRLYRALAATKAGALTRREAAALLDGSYNTAKRALGELLDQELVALADRGPPARYRLLDGSVLGAAGELLDPAALAGPG